MSAILPEMKFTGPLYELEVAFFGIKNQSTKLSYFTSLTGRGSALVNTFGHGIGAAVKPIVYLIHTIAYAIFSINKLVQGNFEEAKKHAWDTLNSLGGMLVSPISQTVLAVRAAFGFIFHPGIYFTKRPALIDVALDKNPKLSRESLYITFKKGIKTKELELRITNLTTIGEMKEALAAANSTDAKPLQAKDLWVTGGSIAIPDTATINDLSADAIHNLMIGF